MTVVRIFGNEGILALPSVIMTIDILLVDFNKGWTVQLLVLVAYIIW